MRKLLCWCCVLLLIFIWNSNSFSKTGSKTNIARINSTLQKLNKSRPSERGVDESRDFFKDVSVNHWAFKAVKKLYDDGIVIGFPVTHDFRGDRPITRYSMATIIARLMEKLKEKLASEKLSAEHLNIIKKLLTEFSDDLSNFKINVAEFKKLVLENFVSLENKLKYESKKRAALESKLNALKRRLDRNTWIAITVAVLSGIVAYNR